MFNSIRNAWGYAWDAASGMVAGAGAEWNAAVADLRAKASEFVRVYERLQQARLTATPEQRGRIDALLSRGRWVMATVRGITASVDWGANLFPKNLAGLAVQRGAMGALPLIPLAAIVGGVAVITAWLSDAYVELRKMDLAEQGIAYSSGGGGVPGWVVYPALVVGGYVLYRTLTK